MAFRLSGPNLSFMHIFLNLSLKVSVSLKIVIFIVCEYKLDVEFLEIENNKTSFIPKKFKYTLKLTWNVVFFCECQGWDENYIMCVCWYSSIIQCEINRYYLCEYVRYWCKRSLKFWEYIFVPYLLKSMPELWCILKVDKYELLWLSQNVLNYYNLKLYFYKNIIQIFILKILLVNLIIFLILFNCVV